MIRNLSYSCPYFFTIILTVLVIIKVAPSITFKVINVINMLYWFSDAMFII